MQASSSQTRFSYLHSKWLSTVGITLVFILLYFGARSIPNTQCDILHYEVTNETANGIEMCADGPGGLMDLKRVKFPGKLAISSDTQFIPNEPYKGRISILGPSGEALLPHEVAITHAEKVHLIAIDKNLNDYHHVHPQNHSNGGEWEFSFSPQTNSEYDIYVECVPVRTRKQLIVNGTLHPQNNNLTSTSESSEDNIQTHQADIALNYKLNWEFAEQNLRAGSWVDFTISIEHIEGEPFVLQKFMDAYSHVVAFRHGTTGYAHIHPNETTVPSNSSVKTFSYTFYTGESGTYRFWAQFMINGQEITLPHDIEID